MSYDWYCYRSASGVPDVKEAEELVDSFQAAEESGDQIRPGAIDKETLAAALIEHNPQLQRFVPDYKQIAEFENSTEDKARARFTHIELNTPEDSKVPFQLVITDNYVFVTIPYSYAPEQADEVFPQILEHLRVIKRSTGCFVYDPQKGIVFDPETIETIDHVDYDRVVEQLPTLIAKTSKQEQNKPWWRFWR